MSQQRCGPARPRSYIENGMALFGFKQLQHKGYRVRWNRFEAFIRYNGENTFKSFETAPEARAWYLMKRAECVNLAEIELGYKEAWYQKLKRVHAQLA